jgi:hypothetical protein
MGVRDDMLTVGCRSPDRLRLGPSAHPGRFCLGSSSARLSAREGAAEAFEIHFVFDSEAYWRSHWGRMNNLCLMRRAESQHCIAGPF